MNVNKFKHTLDWSAWLSKNPIKHKNAPSQSKAANPPKRCSKNLTNEGIVGGGVNLFNPSLARTSACFSLVKPW